MPVEVRPAIAMQVPPPSPPPVIDSHQTRRLPLMIQINAPKRQPAIVTLLA